MAGVAPAASRELAAPCLFAEPIIEQQIAFAVMPLEVCMQEREGLAANCKFLSPHVMSRFPVSTVLGAVAELDYRPPQASAGSGSQRTWRLR
jgi:hypothetical protein